MTARASESENRSLDNPQPVVDRWLPRNHPAADGSGTSLTLDQLPFSVSRAYDLDITTAMDLRIPIAGSVSGSVGRRVVVLERAAYAQSTEPNGDEVQTGYAIRYCLTVSKLTVDAKLTLPWLAASAQIGAIEAQWIMQVVGLAGKKIDEVSMVPTELTLETFVLAKQSLAKIIEAIRDPDTHFIPTEIARRSAIDAYKAVLTDSIGRTLGLSFLSNGTKLSRLPAGLPQPLREQVAAVYDRVAGINTPDATPNDDQKQRARDLLGKADASWKP